MKNVTVEGTDHLKLEAAMEFYFKCKKYNASIGDAIQQIIDALGEAPAVGFDEWWQEQLERFTFAHPDRHIAQSAWQAAQAQHPDSKRLDWMIKHSGCVVWTSNKSHCWVSYRFRGDQYNTRNFNTPHEAIDKAREDENV